MVTVLLTARASNFEVSAVGGPQTILALSLIRPIIIWIGGASGGRDGAMGNLFNGILQTNLSRRMVYAGCSAGGAVALVSCVFGFRVDAGGGAGGCTMELMVPTIPSSFDDKGRRQFCFGRTVFLENIFPQPENKNESILGMRLVVCHSRN